MPTPELSFHLAQEAQEAFVRIGDDFSNQEEAAASIGISRGAFMNRVRKYRDFVAQENGEIRPGFEVVRQSETYDADGNVRSRSVVQKPETGGKFHVPQGHKIKGVSAFLDANGNVSGQWVRTTDAPDPIEAAKVIAETVAAYEYTPINIQSPQDTDEDLATVYPLADLHLGLLAWRRESGQDWDLDIAQREIIPAIARCIQSSPNSKQCVILGLGDLLHFDGYEPVTSRSRNFLDADGRYPKVLSIAVKMLVDAITMALEKHENVLVRVLAGNHDDQSAIAVALALALKYETEPRVSIDDCPSRFWWWRWGKVLLGATHGDKVKMRDLPMVMAVDCKDDWGEATYQKIYTGHIHHESRIEEGGVIVESMRAPVAKDAYHASAKYRSGRSIYSETFSKSGREVGRVSINL